jgi:hypothetical protein
MDADAFSGLPDALKPYHAVDKRKQRIIASQTDIDAGLEFGAALADQNASGSDSLAAKCLHAKTLCLTVPSVFGASTTFFMSHDMP